MLFWGSLWSTRKVCLHYLFYRLSNFLRCHLSPNCPETIDQTRLEFRSTCLCLPIAGMKSVHKHHLALLSQLHVNQHCFSNFSIYQHSIKTNKFLPLNLFQFLFTLFSPFSYPSIFSWSCVLWNECGLTRVLEFTFIFS